MLREKMHNLSHGRDANCHGILSIVIPIAIKGGEYGIHMVVANAFYYHILIRLQCPKESIRNTLMFPSIIDYFRADTISADMHKF